MDARLEGVSLFQYSLQDLEVEFDLVLLRIAAISGIKIPADAFFLDVVKKEIVVFLLNFGYGELSVAEIILAFHLNSKINIKYPIGIEIKNVLIFGDCINAEYVSQVLYNYMTIRNLLDRKLENSINGY